MIPEIDYLKAENLPQALEALAASKEKARLLAGGTDILPGFHIRSKRFRDVRLLIDISHLPELTSIVQKEDGLHIGAATTFTSIVKHPIIKEHYPLLAQASAQIGSVQIRNRATIAGNFVNNAPCADSVPPLLIYDAQIIVRSVNGQRRLPLGDFLLKPYRTQLAADEVVTEIILPHLNGAYRGEFYKLGRRRGVAISRITLAVLLKMQSSVIDELRLAAGAITPIGKRFPELEALAKGQKTTPDFLKELSIRLGEQILQVTGLRWSSPYKLPVVQQAFYNVLRKLSETARE